MAIALAMVVVASKPADASLADRSMYQYTSESGDYVGGGGAERYTPANATLSVKGTAAFLTVSVRNDTDSWSIDLAAPLGEKLHRGMYYDAERAAFRTGTAPGLDVSGNHRGCNEVWGSFAINQIATNEAGKVIMLDATFTQHCESPTAPTLEGRVMLNAQPLSYDFKSDPGDYIGGGMAKTYLGATSTFSLNGTKEALQYRVSGEGDNWTALIEAPTGRRLRARTYTTARFADANHAGLDVFGNGRGCNESTGTLTITTITLDGRGNINDLAARFEQHCEGAAAALRGTIRYHD
jgi:hypothetical protein